MTKQLIPKALYLLNTKKSTLSGYQIVAEYAFGTIPMLRGLHYQEYLKFWVQQLNLETHGLLG